MYIYRYTRPFNINFPGLNQCHAVPFSLRGSLELHINAETREWSVLSSFPLDANAWLHPHEVDDTKVQSIYETDPAQFWVERSARNGTTPNSFVISGDQVTSIEKLPLEQFTSVVRREKGWLRIAILGAAKGLRPQEDALFEIEISSNSRSIADQVAQMLAAKVVCSRKKTFAYSSELPYLVRPPIQNARYFPPHESIFDRIKKTPRSLTLHTLVGGSAGSGKTNTLRNLLDVAVELNVPGILVIDPFDSFKPWAKSHSIQYLEAGQQPNELAFLNCNPFVCPDRMRLGPHLDILSNLFACAVAGGGGAMLPFYVRKVLDRFFQHLWNLDDQAFESILAENGCRLRSAGYFRFQDNPVSELKSWWETNRDSVIQSVFAGTPSGELSNLKLVLHGRFSDLPRSFISHFNYKCDRGLDHLLDRRMVISLRGCSDSESDFLMGVLSVYYVESAILRDSSHVTGNVLALDEAHRVIGKPKAGTSEFITVGERLAKHFSKAIKELRGRGVGVILADQNPSELINDAQSTTGIQIFHRTNSTQETSFIEPLLDGVSVSLPNMTVGSAISKFLDDPITVEKIDLWTSSCRDHET